MKPLNFIGAVFAILAVVCAACIAVNALVYWHQPGTACVFAVMALIGGATIAREAIHEYKTED